MREQLALRVAALSSVAGIGMAGMFGTAAVAANFIGPGTPAVTSASSISKDTGNLHIHKFTPTTESGSRGNGSTVSDLQSKGAQPIGGITFKVWQVKKSDLDIHTNASWQTFSALADTFNQKPAAERKSYLQEQGYMLYEANPSSVTTSEEGTADFSNLPVGYYYVEESDPSTGGECKVNHKVTPCSQITGVDPFLVSLPLTDPSNHNSWLYDVNVYPKNDVSENKKSVVDVDAAGAGNNDKSQLIYTILTGLPRVADSYQSYKVVDPLSSKLTYNGSGDDANKDSVEAVKPATGAGSFETVTTFVKTEDYALNADSHGVVTLSFTSSGLQKLIKARNEGATKVRWMLHAKVNQLTDAKTDIQNTAYQLPPNEANPSWDLKQHPGNPTNTVVSKYGRVSIHKIGTGNDAHGLNGAVFQLYMCQKLSSGSVKLGTQVTVNNQNSWTSANVSGTNGKIEITGLRLNDWINGSSVDASKSTHPTDWYCLKETTAPSGYELIPEPVPFQILTGSNDYTASLEIKDVPSNGGFHLPVTGGQGIALLVLAGGLLIVGSVIYTVSSSKRRKQKA